MKYYMEHYLGMKVETVEEMIKQVQEKAKPNEFVMREMTIEEEDNGFGGRYITTNEKKYVGSDNQLNLFQSKLASSIYGFTSDSGFLGAKRNNPSNNQQPETRNKEDSKSQPNMVNRRVCCADRIVVTGEPTLEMGQVGVPCSSQAVIEKIDTSKSSKICFSRNGLTIENVSIPDNTTISFEF